MRFPSGTTNFSIIVSSTDRLVPDFMVSSSREPPKVLDTCMYGSSRRDRAQFPPLAPFRGQGNSDPEPILDFRSRDEPIALRGGRYLSDVYITIDPGTNLGWAIWNVKGLVACGLGDPRSSQKHVVTSDTLDADVIHDVWIEDQVIYPRSPVPPSDILTLAKGAYRVAGRYDAIGVTVHFVEPMRWKGQVPKDIHHARVWA